MTMFTADERRIWETSATAENAAMASVALEEERKTRPADRSGVRAELSPMSVALCRDFAAWQTEDGRQQDSLPSEEQGEFEVRLCASRMFLAACARGGSRERHPSPRLIRLPLVCRAGPNA